MATAPPIPTLGQVPVWAPTLLIAASLLILLALGVQWGMARWKSLQGVVDRTDPESRRLRELIDQARADEARLRTVMSEVRAMTDQIAVQLDAHAARLEAMVRHADEITHGFNHPDSPTPSEQARPTVHVRPTNHLVAQSRPTGVQGSMTSVASAGGPSHITQTGASHDPMAAQVYRLADDGLPPVEIAQRLGQHTGKVELILALRQR